MLCHRAAILFSRFTLVAGLLAVATSAVAAQGLSSAALTLEAALARALTQADEELPVAGVLKTGNQFAVLLPDEVHGDRVEGEAGADARARGAGQSRYSAGNCRFSASTFGASL